MFATVLQFAFYYPLKVIVFLLFFTVPLKRRKYFYFRAAGFGVLYILSFFFIPITQGSLYNVVLFTLSMLWMFACFKSTVYALIYTAVGAFAGYHISRYLFELLSIPLDIPSAGFADFFLSLSLCFFVAAVCYFLLVRKVRDIYMIGDVSILVNSAIILGLTIICGELIPEGKDTVNILYYVYAVVSCALALNVQYGLLRRTELENEKKSMENLLSLERKNQEVSRRSIEMVNMRCHDLKHQIELLESEKTDSRRRDQLLGELRRTVSDYESVFNTGNEALDTVLAEKSFLCKKNGITFSYIADGKSLAFLSDVDAYTLFGNALDNAIEAELKEPDPEKRIISLSASKVCGCVRVRVENHFEGEPEFRDGLPVTTKGGEGVHGYGTKSIRYIAEKYGGTLTMAAKDGMFTVNILFPPSAQAQ